MDEKLIGISTAAKLTRYPSEEQKRILSLSRKEIINYSRKFKQAFDKNYDLNKTMMILQIMVQGYFILKNQSKGESHGKNQDS